MKRLFVNSKTTTAYSQIYTNDIASSITVLKDATSAVVYGIDTANGVIIITKRGAVSKPKAISAQVKKLWAE